MRIKLDEDLSPIVASPLEEHGHEVLTVVAQGWSGMKDDALWLLICGEGVMFITADKGFGDIRKYPPGTHPGIILLRPDAESLLEYQKLLRSLLEKHDLEDLKGTCYDNV
jgi:predicted nuclease of predicted toxin-antitoxin system